ncbi:ribosomal protein S16 [Bathycoccus prasinos]|uniref:30S ribosomal protein S16, chloroplastic n=1 Tax=Bathycoccus prasinos TaxID=41875 RepID=K8EPJ2_9CHLO|nr:ribosomal protein S16 [Bathycoccus prasinos]CCO20192.1 ribosomal protein S16 [Bathycoccus prasinos]|eukprot:XP_007508575.1 ribosomal protein S16 [Bathycoccus prasinos]
MSFAASAPTRLNFSNSVCSTQGLSAKIRFTRLGRKRQAFYRLVAIDSKKRRDGLPIEFLGWYDPIKKESSLNAPAIKEWIAKGAQPSETAGSLLKKALIIS